MGYAKLYHTALSNRKIQGDARLKQLSAHGWWLYSMSLIWCSQNETDGFIAPRNIRALAHDDDPDPAQTADELVKRGLLNRKKNGFKIHNYTTRQTSKAEIERIRAGNRERKRKQRASRCHGVSHNVSHGGSHASVTPGVTTKTETETEISLHMSEVAETPEPDPGRVRGERGMLDLVEVEAACYQRYGQLGGQSMAAMRELAPVARWELDALMRTRGRSWPYAIKVLRGMREESARPTPPRDMEAEQLWEDVRRVAQGSRPKRPSPMLEAAVRKLGGRDTLGRATDRQMADLRRGFGDVLDTLRCNGEAHA